MGLEGQYHWFWKTPSRQFSSRLTLALVALTYVVLGSHVLHPRYIVNDNIINRNFIVAGYPLDYMGIFLTGLLHRAYLFQPGVPWYALCLYGVHVISVFMWLTLIWRVFKSWWLVLAFSAVFFAYYLFFLTELDYTSTSEMLCIASMGWACLNVLERKNGYLHYLIWGLAFTLGMWVRPQGVIGSFACVMPVALMTAGHCLRRRPNRQELLRITLTAMVFLAPAVLNWTADRTYRQYILTPQEAAYEAFNVPRGILHGLSPEMQSKINLDTKLLRKAGWTVREGQNFFQWRFLDERTYTPASLHTLLTGAHYSGHPFKDMLDHTILMLESEMGLLLLLLCSLPLFLCASRRHLWLGRFGLALPLYCIALDSFLSVFLTFRGRTEIPFVTSCGFLSLVLASYLSTHPDKDMIRFGVLSKSAAMLLAVIGAAFSVHSLLEMKKFDRNWEILTRNQVNVLNNDYFGSTILMQPNFGLQIESLSPLEVTPLYFHPIDMVWDTFSPYFYDQIKRLGVVHGYELLDAMVDRKGVYFLGREQEGTKIIDAYSHLPKGSVQLQSVKAFKRGINLFRLVTVPLSHKH